MTARRSATVVAAMATVAGLVAPTCQARAQAVPERATSATRAGQARPPLQPSQVAPALRKYRTYVHARITRLVPAVKRLRADLRAHEVAAAKSDWLDARLIWLRIGQDNSAYGIFGDLGQRIDGTAAGHDGGVHDPAFTGFHRIEWDLWHRHDLAAARADAAKLVDSVQRLRHVSLKKAAPSDVDGTSSFVLRSHEIVEDAVRDTLSGNDEYGSGTALAAVTADVAATREVLELLSPLLKPRAPGLVTKARHDLSRLVKVARTARSDGHWVAIKSLGRRKREAIDAAAGAADERLAPIPDLLRIGNT